jgi:glycosyltransferase involved in cell wall biosynthesis
MSRSPTVFFAFRDAPERRAALRTPAALDRYRLFGLDEIARHAVVRHNLERDGAPPAWARAAERAFNGMLDAAGGLGGDFASILASRRDANAADVVFSTVETVGIPVLMLKHVGLIRPPLVYTSVGLPERLARLRNDRMRRFFRDALRSAQTIVTYAASEAARLGDWIGADAPPVVFVPFGVDVVTFRPQPDREPTVDVVSVGADPWRDFGLLTEVASRRPELSFRIVAGRDHARTLTSVPANVTVETDLRLEEVRDRLAVARVVALPVRENSYSGATTVLLQAMAMAKPVVVSRTEAIASGYGLEDGVNCCLVEPGDADALELALVETLTGADAAVSLGIRARETVERGFSWGRYTNALWEILAAAAA